MEISSDGVHLALVFVLALESVETDRLQRMTRFVRSFSPPVELSESPLASGTDGWNTEKLIDSCSSVTDYAC